MVNKPRKVAILAKWNWSDRVVRVQISTQVCFQDIVADSTILGYTTNELSFSKIIPPVRVSYARPAVKDCRIPESPLQQTAYCCGEPGLTLVATLP
jgi:hypothetical protein